MVEAPRIELGSGNVQRKTSTCVAGVLNFATVHAHGQAQRRSLSYGVSPAPHKHESRPACLYDVLPGGADNPRGNASHPI